MANRNLDPGNPMSGDDLYGDRENLRRYRDAARDEHRRFATQLEAQDRGGLPFQDLWTDHDRFDDDLTQTEYRSERRNATQDGHAYATRRDTPRAVEAYRDSNEAARRDHRGRGPRHARKDDRIYEDVCEALTQHDRIDASEINVAVEDGEVTLTGRLRSRNAKRLVTDVVDRISGVRDVHNNIRVLDEQQWPTARNQ
jgi:hypothetical protein